MLNFVQKNYLPKAMLLVFEKPVERTCLVQSKVHVCDCVIVYSNIVLLEHLHIEIHLGF